MRGDAADPDMPFIDGVEFPFIFWPAMEAIMLGLGIPLPAPI
jgi:hypothetical protein